MVVEDIIIRAEYIDMNTGGIKKTYEEITSFAKGIKKTVNITKNFTDEGVKITKMVRTMTGVLPKFRMELLGVMFFGMAVERTFKGLLQPSLDLVDAFQGWSTGLSILFLPVAMDVLNWGLDFLDWVQKLSPEMQTLLNIIAVLGITIGTGLTLYGTLGLAFQALTIASAGWTSALVGLNASLVTLNVTLIPFLAAIAVPAALILGLIGVLKLLQPGIEGFLKKWDELEDALPAPLRIASETIRGIITSLIEGMYKLIDGLLTKLGLLSPKENLISGNTQLGELIYGSRNPYATAGTSTANNISIAPTINVSASSNVDIDQLKSQLGSDWSEQLAMLARR